MRIAASQHKAFFFTASGLFSDTKKQRGQTPRQSKTKQKETAMYLVAGMVRMFRVWRRYNQSLRELNRLDDRELADIGITRCDVQRIAWEAARS
jgi:uncharacterized protein YjiS (DUF1127 family)